VLLESEGGKPVTSRPSRPRERFFTGGRAAERKRSTRRKTGPGESHPAVTIKEAKRLKLDRTEFYKIKTEEYMDGILFGAFVQKVIAPDVKVDEEELKRYYQAHIGEYTFPEMVRIDGLVFSDRKDAEEASEKLRKGRISVAPGDAEGQVEAGKGENLLEFGGQMLDATTLPEEVRKAISGASTGDYRLYADPGNVYYVLDIRERIPSRPLPFESVRGEMEKKVHAEKLQSVLREWEEKLRKASDVKIYPTGGELDRVVNPRAR
jgi:parvulin-like peptidyl-prolyl isomerase